MHPWTAAQLRAFLDWTRENNRELHAAWAMLAMTGMRRGELLALRWRDIDLDAAAVSVRRSAGVVRVLGEGATITEGPTKTGKPRVINLDDATVTRPDRQRSGCTICATLTRRCFWRRERPSRSCRNDSATLARLSCSVSTLMFCLAISGRPQWRSPP